jgi:glycosyltransferase involved in cell wall biosynthesis
MKVILYATNVHEGGGARLLDALISADAPALERLVVVDARYALPQTQRPDVRIRRVPATIYGRSRMEWDLKALARQADAVVCMGNLPPLFRLAPPVTLFLQNRLLLDAPLKGYEPKVKLRIAVERLWLRMRVRNARNVVVQTVAMQRAVQQTLGVATHVVPFLPNLPAEAPSASLAGDKRKFDFLYVSSGLPHKNHLRLVESWRLLAQQNIRPSLCLTVSRAAHADLCRRLDEAIANDRLDITNLGDLPPKRVQALYHEARALIYPSLTESFGLPLFEAAAAKMPIIAAELDYVRDALDPAQTFDPRSPVSIARAVKRQLNIPDNKAAPCGAAEFLRVVLAGSRST